MLQALLPLIWATLVAGRARLHFPVPREGANAFGPTFTHAVWGRDGEYPMNNTWYDGCGGLGLDEAGDIPPGNVLVQGYKTRIQWFMEQPFPSTNELKERVRVALRPLFNDTISWWDNTIHWRDGGGENNDISGSWKVSNATLYPGNEGIVEIVVDVPEDFTCDKCTLQWLWDSQRAGRGWMQCATVTVIPAPEPIVPNATFNPATVGAIRPYTAVLNSTCDNPLYCKEMEWEPSKERTSWALINLLRADPLKYERDFMTGFDPPHPKAICAPGNNRDRLERSYYPFRYDSDLHHSARYHVWDFVTHNHFGQDTSSQQCSLFSGFTTRENEDNACDFRHRMRAFNLNDTDRRYTCTTMEGGEQDGSVLPHEQVNDWADECQQIYQTHCDTIGIGFIPATPVNDADGQPVPLFDNYWAAELGSDDDRRRPVVTTALSGGGSHLHWMGNQVRFFATYHWKTLPISAAVYVDGKRHLLKMWGGYSDDFFSDPKITGWVTDLPVSSDCQSYFFLFLTEDHSFRFPEVGAFRTAGIGSCMEDYDPENHEMEQPMFALFNFTIFGWDPLVEFNIDSRRYYLEREFEQNKAPQRVNLYVVDSSISSDGTSMWMLLYSYDQDNGWWIGGDEWERLLSSGSRAERLESMRISNEGGFKADYVISAAPYSGQVLIEEESSLLEDSFHVFVGGISLSVFLFLCCGVFFVRKDSCGDASWNRCKERFEWTSVLGMACSVTFIYWLFFVVAFTQENSWALSEELPAEVGSLSKTPQICFTGENPVRCQDLAVFAPESPLALLSAAKAFGFLGILAGFAAWFCGLAVLLANNFLSVSDTYGFVATTLLWGNALCTTSAFLVSMLWLIYFNQVLLPLENAGFSPGWPLFVCCLAWLLGLPSWYLASGVEAGAPIERSTGASMGIFSLSTFTKGSSSGSTNIHVQKTRRVEKSRQGDWEKIFDEGQNAFYFFNHRSNVSQWAQPSNWKTVR